MAGLNGSPLIVLQALILLLGSACSNPQAFTAPIKEPPFKCAEGYYQEGKYCVLILDLCFLQKDSNECEQGNKKEITYSPTCDQSTVTKIKISTLDKDVEPSKFQFIVHETLPDITETIVEEDCKQNDIFCYCPDENKDKVLPFSGSIENILHGSGELTLTVKELPANLHLCFLKQTELDSQGNPVCDDSKTKKITHNVCNESTITRILVKSTNFPLDPSQFLFNINDAQAISETIIASNPECSREDIFCYCPSENKSLVMNFTASIRQGKYETNQITLNQVERNLDFSKFVNSDVIFIPDSRTNPDPNLRPQIHLLNFEDTEWNERYNDRLPKLADGSIDLTKIQGVMPFLFYEGEQRWVKDGTTKISCDPRFFTFPSRAPGSGICIAVEDSIHNYSDADYDFLVAAETQSIVQDDKVVEQLRVRYNSISTFGADNYNTIRIYFDKMARFKIRLNIKAVLKDGTNIPFIVDEERILQTNDLNLKNGRYFFDLSTIFSNYPNLRTLLNRGGGVSRYGEIRVDVWDVNYL